VTLYNGGFERFFISTAAPIAAEWNEPQFSNGTFTRRGPALFTALDELGLAWLRT